MATDMPDKRLVWLLEPSEEDELRRLGRVRPYEAGEPLFDQGDPKNHTAALILSGWVRVAAVEADGQEVVFAERGPGAIVGELSAIDRQPRSARVTAMEDVRAVVLTGKRLKDFLLRNPEAMLRLLIAVIGCLRATDRHQVEIRTGKLSYQVIRQLLDK